MSCSLAAFEARWGVKAKVAYQSSSVNTTASIKVLLDGHSSTSRQCRRMTKNDMPFKGTAGNLEQVGGWVRVTCLGGNLGSGLQLRALTWPSFYTQVPGGSAFWTLEHPKRDSLWVSKMKLSGEEAFPHQEWPLGPGKGLGAGGGLRDLHLLLWLVTLLPEECNDLWLSSNIQTVRTIGRKG